MICLNGIIIPEPVLVVSVMYIIICDGVIRYMWLEPSVFLTHYSAIILIYAFFRARVNFFVVKSGIICTPC